MKCDIILCTATPFVFIALNLYSLLNNELLSSKKMIRCHRNTSRPVPVTSSVIALLKVAFCSRESFSVPRRKV